MFKNLLKKTKPLKLGRWGVTYESQVLEKRINWANHDHCGSEVCETHFQNENQSIKNKERKGKEVEKKVKIIVDENKLLTKTEPFDPLLPFCM